MDGAYFNKVYEQHVFVMTFPRNTQKYNYQIIEGINVDRFHSVTNNKAIGGFQFSTLEETMAIRNNGPLISYIQIPDNASVYEDIVNIDGIYYSCWRTDMIIIEKIYELYNFPCPIIYKIPLDKYKISLIDQSTQEGYNICMAVINFDGNAIEYVSDTTSPAGLILCKLAICNKWFSIRHIPNPPAELKEFALIQNQTANYCL